MRKSPKLGLWVANQRQNFKKDKLLPINGLSFWIQSISYMGRTTSYSMDEHVCLKSLSSTRSNTKKILWYQKNMIRTPKLAGHWVILQRCYYKKDKLYFRIKSNWSFDEFDWFWMGSSYISGIQKKSGRPYVSKTRSVQKKLCITKILWYYHTVTKEDRSLNLESGCLINVMSCVQK